MHCVDLGESFQTHVFLQNLASIQPRTSPLKFAATRVASATFGKPVPVWVCPQTGPPHRLRADSAAESSARVSGSPTTKKHFDVRGFSPVDVFSSRMVAK